MPHVIVKLWSGKTEAQKRRLTEAITADVMKVLHYGEESDSVALEEVDPQHWAEEVYRPDIAHFLNLLRGSLLTSSMILANARVEA